MITLLEKSCFAARTISEWSEGIANREKEAEAIQLEAQVAPEADRLFIVAGAGREAEPAVLQEADRKAEVIAEIDIGIDRDPPQFKESE